VLDFADGKEIGEGKIISLQRDRKTVKEIHSGYEFAFMTDNFQDWHVDDNVMCLVEETD